jgi:hypothetical protein
MSDRRRVFLVAGALLAGATLARVRAQDPPKPLGLAGVGLTQEQVDAAVERGKSWLLKQVGKRWDGDAPFEQDDFLVAAALAHTSAYAQDPALVPKALRGLYGSRQLGKTYETALTIMTLEHLGGPLHRDKIAECAQALLDGTGDSYGWNYGDAVAPRVIRPPGQGTVPDPVITSSGGAPIAALDSRATVLARTNGKSPSSYSGDNSNSQFALLGLHSAAAVGVVASDSVWDQAVTCFAHAQGKDGGWPYRDGEAKTYLSMTCAGLSGLAISLGHEGKNPLEDARVRLGLDWLAKHWSLEVDPSTEAWVHYYSIYGLERAGVLLGQDFFGEHEWYPEGAKWLLGHQRPDGSWFDEGKSRSQVHDTCFALLFLKRATTPLAVAKGGTGSLRTRVVPSPAEKKTPTGLLFILDASDSMNDKINGRTKFEIVKEAAKKLVNAIRDDTPVGLRVYGHHPSNPRKVDEWETELLIPVGKLDREQFTKIVDGIKPQGRTPIAMSFDRVNTNDLRNAPPCRVLLLSDGAETGGGDPVKSALALSLNPKCVAIDCLGFDLATEPEARKQLLAIALNARGRFTESIDPDMLAQAGARLSQEYALLDAQGKELAKGLLGDTRTLAEGRYRIRVLLDGAPHELDFWINTGVETVVSVDPSAVKRR